MKLNQRQSIKSEGRVLKIGEISKNNYSNHLKIQQLNNNFFSNLTNPHQNLTQSLKKNTIYNDCSSLKEQELLSFSYNLCKSQSGCISLQQAINTFSDFADKLFLKVIYFINNSFSSLALMKYSI